MEPIFLYISFFILLIIFINERGANFDAIIFGVIVTWYLINIFSSIFNGQPFEFNLVTGYLVRIVISYLIIKIIGEKFWIKFEYIIFKLTILAIIIFGLNLLFPGLFFSLSNIFRPITAKIYTDRYPYYWTSIIYTHDYNNRSIDAIGNIRNSGFMWEPGAFAMILTIIILYNWYTNGFDFSNRVKLYFIALISTLSTAGYFCLIVLFSIYLIKSKNKYAKFFGFTLSIIIIPALFKLDFIGKKLTTYISNMDDKIGGPNQFTYGGSMEVNRLAAFFIKGIHWLHYPLGYGDSANKIIKGQYTIIDGVNGLGDILEVWGIVGMVFLVVSLYKYFVYLNAGYKVSTSIIVLSILTMFIILFSNPISQNPFLFFIIFTPYLFKAKKIKIAKN
jgi:hypothetical protein